MNNFELLIKFIKINALIFFYVIGIAYLTNYFPSLLIACLISSLLIIQSIAVISIMDQYLIQSLPITHRIRIFGFHDWVTDFNSLTAGIYFGLFTLISALLLTDRKLRSNFIICVALSTSFCVCLTTTYLTGTRTALVALASALLFSLLIQHKLKSALVIGIAFTLLVLYGVFGESEYLNNLITRGGIGSLRPQIWSAAINSGFDNIVFGAGMGAESELQVTYQGTILTIPHSHNHYLQLLIWTGAVGLILYILMITRAISLSLSSRSTTLSMITCVGLVYFLVVQFFDVFTVFTMPSYYWPCLWLLLGIGLGTIRRI